jgi:hypothetical protein
MFSYFGYGSNISLISLRAKGVVPVSSLNARLNGWSLKFNVEHWFEHEGGMGNIEPSDNPNDFVEGIVHLCQDEHLARLDTMEAYGVGYDRVEVSLETDEGIKKALAYIGLPAFINNNCLPTKRYLNIIIQGAESANLSSNYIKKLRNSPIYEMKIYPEFQHPREDSVWFDEQALGQDAELTGLAGAVFDMRNARPKLDSVKKIFGGKDMTVFHLKRHDTSTGTETIEDYLEGRITNGQLKYINTYLHEYLKEFQYLGRLSYAGSS